MASQEVVGLINDYDCGAFQEIPIAGFGQQIAADDIRDNFACIELIGNPAETNAEQLPVTVDKAVDLLSQLLVSRCENALEGGGCEYPIDACEK